MKRKLFLNCGVVILGILLIASFIPFTNQMVDDRWVYGVKDMREVFSEANYNGQEIGDGVFVLDVRTSQGMDLNFWKYISYKRWEENLQ